MWTVSVVKALVDVGESAIGIDEVNPRIKEQSTISYSFLESLVITIVEFSISWWTYQLVSGIFIK